MREEQIIGILVVVGRLWQARDRSPVLSSMIMITHNRLEALGLQLASISWQGAGMCCMRMRGGQQWLRARPAIFLEIIINAKMSRNYN